ncbi:DUF2726 domain-containing protein [Methylobacillus methanolivorans]|uniref:DUF2726 domain-containing protein n=1 Tax=Methylobacillus methanolivorans TaxID=1848927 RepID=A0ABW8GNL2_9PROT
MNVSGIISGFLPLLLIFLALQLLVKSFRPKKRWRPKSRKVVQFNKPEPAEAPQSQPAQTQSLASHKTLAADLPYEQRKPLTASEAVFYYRLVKALPQCIILPQVQLSSFIKLKNAAWYVRLGNSYALHNRIAQQSVDYLVCLKDFTIVAAVELDDRSHANKARQKLDIKKEESLKAAGIALVRWHAEQMPSAEAIYKRFSTEQETVNE